jgi:tetratricopeptide (TPR) repeat protein/DNA-binding MarR family transcriptional regulator
LYKITSSSWSRLDLRVPVRTHLPVEILDYVRTHDAIEDRGYGIGQGELAKALGYHPCSMSRPLEELVRAGHLLVQRAQVRDGVRKRLTYHLTSTGVARLRRETSGVPLLSSELPPTPHPFLGRKTELDELASISEGAAAVTVISGAGGMGKTALMTRFLRRSAQTQGRVPFWYTLRPASSPRQFVDALAHSLSSLGRPQLAYYAQLPRAPLPREVADLAARALEDRGLSAVIDDFHLAGGDLRGFIVEFVDALGPRGRHHFYFVGQGSIDPKLHRLPVRQVAVDGLDRSAAHELTDRQGGLGPRFEEIYRATGGSPLLLKLAVPRPEAAIEQVDLPTASVSRLAPDELRAITPAAVSNEPLPASFLLEDHALTEDRLKDLAHSGILQPALHGRYEMLQAIGTALRGRVNQADEQAAHRRLAQFYARSHRPEPLRERFLHLVQGGEWKVAAELLAEHEREIFRLGYSDPLRHNLRVLASSLPVGSAKVRAYLSEATLLRQHSEYADAIAALRHAVELSPPDDRMRAEGRLRIVDLFLKLGNVRAAEKEFSEAQREIPASHRLAAYLSLTKARLAEGHGEWKLAAAEYQRAFEAARHAHAGDLALESIASWSKFAEPTGGPEVSLRLIKEALPNARHTGAMDIVFNLRLVRARAYSDLGRPDEAEEEVAGVRSEAESLGYLTQLTYALSGLAAVATERQQWDSSASYAKQASELAERLGNALVLGHTLATLCTSELRQGERSGNATLIQAALDHGTRGVEVLEGIGPTDSLVLAHTYLVEVYLNLRQPERAVEHFERARAISKDLGLKTLWTMINKELGERVAAATPDSSVGGHPDDKRRHDKPPPAAERLS